MRTHFENQVGPNGQRVALLRHKTAELERELAEARMSLEQELAQPGFNRRAASGQIRERQNRERHHRNFDDAGHEHAAGAVSAPAEEFGSAEFGPAQFDFADSEFAGPDFAESRFSGPHFTEPRFTGPDFTGPDFTQPDVAEPGLAEREFAGPANFRERDFAEPEFTEPGLTERGLTERGLTERGLTERDFAAPDFGERDFAEREFAEREFAEPADFGQGDFAEPDFGERDFAERDFAEPDVAGPYVAGSGFAEPYVAGLDFAEPGPGGSFGRRASSGRADSTGGRTETFVNRGRGSNYRLGLPRGRKVAAATALVAVLGTIAVVMLSRGGPSWPPSVATVQSEAARACQNPDVKSEPGQVNFACAPATRQILWAFSMMTSANDPNFADAKTGRLGLEPITPGQGGELAWSLNLHHPYNPSNPVDSLEVAARAINNIIGGATLSSATGTPVVQPGLESDAHNCLRYTGSAALQSRAGFPSLCARPVFTLAGQAALVADVYQKWVVGAPPAAAEDAAVLFENANNPGDPQVQAILRQLVSSGLSA